MIKEYVLDKHELKNCPSKEVAGKTVYVKRDVKLLAYKKYGGKNGLMMRLRSKAKQRQLLKLSQFGAIKTRPVDLLLDE